MVAQVVRVQSPVLVLGQAMLLDIRVVRCDSRARVAFRSKSVVDDEEKMDGRVRADGFEKVWKVQGRAACVLGVPYCDESDIRRERRRRSVLRSGGNYFAVVYLVKVEVRMVSVVLGRVEGGGVVRRA